MFVVRDHARFSTAIPGNPGEGRQAARNLGILKMF
jgi:hypothetical protein